MDIEKKIKELKKIKGNKVYNESVLDFKTKNKYDLTLVMTVLIHINKLGHDEAQVLYLIHQYILAIQISFLEF